MDAPKTPDGKREVFSWSHAIRGAKLQMATKCVLYTINTYMANDGTGCFPSLQTIADDAGMGRSTVAEHIKKAIVAGLLYKEHRVDDAGDHTSNLYLPAMPDDVVLGKKAKARKGGPGAGLPTGKVVQEADHGSPGAGLQVVQELDTNYPLELHTEEKSPNPEIRGTENDLNIDDDQEDTSAVLSKGKRLLADLMADGRHHSVVESLLAPILTQRRFSADDAIGELRSLRAAAKDLPKPALEKAVAIVLAGPKTVKAQRIRDALKAATMVAKADAADAVPVDADTERVRSGLRKRLGDDVYRSWFAGMTVRNDGGRMLLVVERPFYASYVIANFTLDVEAVAGASARVISATELRT